ncbi:hypothetical protein FNF31_03424 [Cafeteria roenbergensis]|uniref:Major facilitator superfamily (MFS) profile domain-containing protein n=2 Tax=Cafeteria roenbergensis TaxID=33653 RepID=A0A5A8DBA3_CAFRO|nr:hypothetical protein FNF31_03424 [Cafeteria roenbergensis]
MRMGNQAPEPQRHRQRKGARSGAATAEAECTGHSPASRRPDDDDDASTVAGKHEIAVVDAPGGDGSSHVEAAPMKDIPSLLLLLLLYTLQGVPMGLASAIPIMLQSSGFGFGAKALFSFAAWPYSLKVLWSPVVDAVYSDAFGRRKSWVVPVQIITGLVMIAMGMIIDDELVPGAAPNLWRLTAAFFALYFLVATQDIAVDGWALTMLRPENVGLASVCNSVGQTAGYIISYALLLALGDAEFCNSYLRVESARSDSPIVTLGSFMLFWGAVFVVITALVGIFKSEKAAAVQEGRPPPDHSFAAAGAAIRHSYHDAWRVLTLPSVLKLIVVLLTARAAFAAIQGGMDLELLQKGVPKQTLLVIGLVYTPFEIVFSLMASKWTAGSRPLGVWTSAYPLRIAIGLGLLLVVSALPDVQPGEHSEHPLWWYVVLVALFVSMRLSANVMFVAQMAFSNRIADDRIGGTYMTILNTVSNAGAMWSTPVALMSIEFLEQSGCYSADAVAKAGDSWLPFVNMGLTASDRLQLPNSKGMASSCITQAGWEQCAAAGGQCSHLADGYALTGLACTAIGLLWFAFFWGQLNHLQDLPKSAWLLVSEKGGKRDSE